MITNRNRTYVFILSVFAILFVATAGCKKDKEKQIPYVYVNFYVKPNSTEYIELNSVNGWVYVTGGYKGIILYRKSQDEFMAYDRACPYDPDEGCALIEVEESYTTAIDSCCGSRFLLLDGSPFAGPATQSLKQYRTNFDGTTLHIYN